jgi:apolipoprotein N-acyltransferase
VGWHWLQWVGLIPLLWAWESLGKRAACLAGLGAGLAAQLALFTWLAPAFSAYADAPPALAWLGFALYALWEALPFAALGLLDWAFRSRCPRWRWLLFALALVGLEWLWPRVFAWRVGAPQVQALWVAPLAALLGPLGLTLLVGVVNGGLFAALRRRRPLPGVAAVLALVAALAFGASWVESGSGEGKRPALRVAWVQPGVVSRRGENAAEVWQALEEGCRAVGAELGQERADLCVLPEGISPEAWMNLAPNDDPAQAELQASWERRLSNRRRALRSRVANLSRLARAPVLIGLTKRVVKPHGEQDLEVVARTNACLITRSHLSSFTGKRRLLPFAEELPSESLRSLLPMAGRYSPAEGTGVVPLASGRSESKAGVLVCYEAIWARPFGAEAPALLVNPTNDDWFTGQGPALHAMLCRLRAVEARRPFVRVAATGISFVQNGQGELLAWAPGGPASGVATLYPEAADTPFTRWGEGWAALLGLLALALPLGRWSAPARD